jgi:hypothetical protein
VIAVSHRHVNLVKYTVEGAKLSSYCALDSGIAMVLGPIGS